MIRPERMSSTSIICVRQDVESLLQTLSSFGEFHIEHAAEDASVSEYTQNIQKVEESQSNVNELIKQLCQEKAGFLDIFKISEPEKIQVTTENWETLSGSTCQQILVLKKQVDELNASLSSLQEKTAHLNHVKSMLKTMGEMKVDLAAVKESKLIHLAVASMPHKNYDALQTALFQFPIILNRSQLPKETDFIYVAVPGKYSVDVDKILKAHHADIFVIPQDLPHNVTDALSEVNDRLKDDSEKEKAILSALKKLGEENAKALKSWKETIGNILELLNAKKKILQSGRLATIEGYIPTKNFATLNEKVHAMLGEKAIVLQGGTAKVEAQTPPTKISNNRFVKPFEEVTKLYGLPHYNEVDPTPFMAITFPILFGLMFGDVGDGLVLLIGGLALGFLIKKGQAIKNVCWIMATCGITSIIAGFLYGEFFGKELFPPLWFSPFQNVFDFLILSLIIGAIQIVSGLILEMIDFALKHNYIDAILTSIPRIAFYIGAVSVIIVYKLDFAAWFSGPILLIIVPFILMVIAKPTYLAFSKLSFRSIETQTEEALGESNPGHEESLGQRIFEGGDLVTRLLSNSISYTRILALLMAHWALLLVTYTVAGLVASPTIVGFIISGIIIVGGNVFVIALEGLIVFIHTLRLHFYEWFSKFYQGTGKEFKPFKQNFTHTEVVFKRKEA